MKQIMYTQILEAQKASEKLLAILLDPDKIQWQNINQLIAKIKLSPATHIFVGGSIVLSDTMSKLIDAVRESNLPIFIFPGHPAQISPNADGLLLLSLISGRNPDYLIGHHVNAAHKVKNSGLEIIPTAYILIDGQTESAVKRVSKTVPLSQGDIEIIVSTAIAGELIGNKLIYLEAGSGAQKCVSPEIIEAVCANTNIPVIAGGGITSAAQIAEAYTAGASLVVIGTAFENDINFFETL